MYRGVIDPCSGLLKCSMFRGLIERDRDIEERRRDEMAEKLSVYKREVMSTNQSIVLISL